MKKVIISFIIFLILVNIQSLSYAFSIYISDPINNAWHHGMDPDDADRIGNPYFEIFGINLSVGQANTVIDIYSNYSNAIHSVAGWNTYPADLSIEISGHEYGLALTNFGAAQAGTLYDQPLWALSNEHKPNNGINYIYHQNRKVTIKSGDIISSGNTVSWLVNDTLNNPNIADWRIHIELNNSDFSENISNGFDFFYGGATCANDFIGGHATPEPSSSILLGIGIFGITIKNLKRKMESKAL